MLAKSTKLKWGMGHRALKVIYSGAIEPILTYGAPVWEKALTKQNNVRKYHQVQRMMNIKIAKAFRTLSYEASCVLAGIRPIRLAIEEKVRTYKANHNNIEYDALLEVRYWPHPPEVTVIGAPTEHTAQCNKYRLSQEECARLREGVPYVKVYRYNPKHLYPKLNSYGDNGQRSLKL